MADPCADSLEEWQEAYDAWSACSENLSEFVEDYAMAVAAAEIACAGAVATVETIVGGIVGGAACAAALGNMYDKADDWGNEIDNCSGLAEDSNENGDAYQECVESHKEHYAPSGQNE